MCIRQPAAVYRFMLGLFLCVGDASWLSCCAFSREALNRMFCWVADAMLHAQMEGGWEQTAGNLT